MLTEQQLSRLEDEIRSYEKLGYIRVRIKNEDALALIALARIFFEQCFSKNSADERTLYMQAIDSTYPIPNNPNQSVVQRAMDDRIAFTEGWDKACAALGQKKVVPRGNCIKCLGTGWRRTDAKCPSCNGTGWLILEIDI